MRPSVMPKKKGRRRVANGRRELIGTVAAVLLVAFTLLFAFGRQQVAVGGTEIKGQFTSANQLKKGSVVRRAGLDIGKVSRVEATESGQALVTMRLNDDAPSLSSDIKLLIRPRLAFEGNFYVDVRGGSPRVPPLAAGDVIPLRNTTAPVQLDEVLNTFNRPVLSKAKTAIAELGRGLGSSGEPSAAEQPGYQSLQTASRELNTTLRPLTRVARAMQGQRAGDLPNAIDSTGDFTSALGRDPRALADIVTNYRHLVGALGDNDTAVSATIEEAAATLRIAPRSLARLDAALPDVRRVSDAARPTLKALPATLGATSFALDQIDGLASAKELPAAVRSLSAPVRALPDLQRRVNFAAPLVTSIGRCLSEKIVPVLNKTVPDGKFTLDQPVWLELLHAATGLAGGSPGFDAGGTTFRAGLGAGDQGFSGVVPGIGEVSGVVSPDLQGVRPVWLGANNFPTKRPDAPCVDQELVNLESTIGTAYEGMKVNKTFSLSKSASGSLDDLKRLSGQLGRQLTPRPQPVKRRPGKGSGTPAKPSVTPAPVAAPKLPGDPPTIKIPGVKDLLDSILKPKDPKGDGAPAPSNPVADLLDSVLGK